jgi:predicted RNase H-like HicB family nuclease
MYYIALVHKDPDSDFGVSFPDFPGLVTAGRTLEEAKAMAEEALALHIAGMEEDGEDIPEPLSLDELMATDPMPPAIIPVLASVRQFDSV